MPSKIKQIIDIIKSEYPSISKSEIEDMIGNDIEKNLEKYRTNIELRQQQNTQVSIGTRFRKNIPRHKSDIESLKKEVISQLESEREKCIQKGQLDHADNLTKDIGKIEDTTGRCKLALLDSDTHIAGILVEEEAESIKANRTIQDLKRLLDASK